jgi:hypothetical protein
MAVFTAGSHLSHVMARLGELDHGGSARPDRLGLRGRLPLEGGALRQENDSNQQQHWKSDSLFHHQPLAAPNHHLCPFLSFIDRSQRMHSATSAFPLSRRRL